MRASPRPHPGPAHPPWRAPRETLPVSIVLLLVVGAALALPTLVPAASADLVVWPWFTADEVSLDDVHVAVHSAGGLARTNLTFVVHNAADVPGEANFDVPLPPHATLVAFALELENETWHGIVQERSTARESYDEAKARGEDAVLLESADDTRFRLHLNVPAGADRTLHVAYVESVPIESGARTYRLPLSGLSDLPDGLAHLQVTTRIESSAGVSSVTFPGLALEPTDTATTMHVAAYEGHDLTEVEDVVAHWDEGDTAWWPSLVTSVAPGSAGADDAALVASFLPPSAHDHLPRDIVFVLDSSGSMGGSKIIQARDSLREVLLTLRPDDRFGLVRFSEQTERLTTELQPATDDAVQQARALLAEVDASGSTNFDGGLQAALDLLGSGTSGRVPVVVVLSDGLPTAGVTDPASIVSRMQSANEAEAAVHILAIGLDADDTFLEDIAAASGGSLHPLAPDADLRHRLAGFYATLQDPVLTDVTITIDGPGVHGIYPTVVPALYAGSAMQVAFRADLSASSEIVVHVTGVAADGPAEHTFTFRGEAIRTLAEAEQVWGSHHVAALLSRERTDGTDPELRDEIVDAAVAYGIVTRYTSWVIVAPQPEVVPDDLERSGAPAPVSTPTATSRPIPLVGYDQGAQGTNGGGLPTSGGDTGAADEGSDDASEATPHVGVAVVVAALALLVAVVRRRS